MLKITPIENNLINIFCEKHKTNRKIRKYEKQRYFCKECNKEIKIKEYENNFKIKSSKIHNYKYTYDKVEYINNTSKVKIFCKEHNTYFTQSPNDHAAGKVGCEKCISRLKSDTHKLTQDQCIENFKRVHNDKYDYSLVDYEKTHKKVKIICSEHGVFKMTPAHHGQGENCPKCSRKRQGGWTRTNFKEKCNKNNNGLGTFYILRCWNEEEEFYKIGITSHSIKKRYESKKDLPYSYEIIYEYFNNPEHIFNLETLIKHKVLKGLNYNCKLFFGGCKTEVFKLSSTNLDKVISLLK